MSNHYEKIMSNHYEKMKFEMELCGYSLHKQRHYLSHVRLLEKFSGKPLVQISPDEIKQYLHYRIKKGISYSNINISRNDFSESPVFHPFKVSW